jgi:hypothetical protein
MYTVKKKITLSLLHAVLLLLLVWAVNCSSFSFSADEALLKKACLVENALFPNPHPSLPSFLFVNVSKDIWIVKDSGDYGKMTITDRGMLASFFRYLADHQNRHRYVLCDIFFQYPSDRPASDSELLRQINRCQNLIFPCHLQKDGTIERPFLPLEVALADFQTFDGKFAKFRLCYQDSIATIPWVMHRQLDPPQSASFLPGLPAIAPRYYITPDNLTGPGHFSYINLGELPRIDSLDPGFYDHNINGALIVVGNLTNAGYDTPLGRMPDDLILLNTYLSLRSGRNRLTWAWILTMYSLLSVLSYFFLFHSIRAPSISVSHWIRDFVNGSLKTIFSYLGICATLVFLSEILFSIPLVLSPLFGYLLFMDWVIRHYREHHKTHPA